MSEVTITTEPLTDALIAEIVPLGQKCWDESTKSKGAACAFYGERDFKIEPNVPIYKSLAETGCLVIVVLRDEGEAKGYALGWSYQALHHKTILGAIGDTFYIEPDYRSYAAVVVDQFVNEMLDRKVQILGWPAFFDGYLYKLLAARGFVGDDIVMEKRLCV